MNIIDDLQNNEPRRRIFNEMREMCTKKALTEQNESACNYNFACPK